MASTVYLARLDDVDDDKQCLTAVDAVWNAAKGEEIVKHGDVYSVRVHRVPGNGPFWGLTIWMSHDTEGNPWVDSLDAGGDYEDGAFYLWVDPSNLYAKTPAADDEVPF